MEKDKILSLVEGIVVHRGYERPKSVEQHQKRRSSGYERLKLVEHHMKTGHSPILF
jgi:hypothetical protein